MTTDREISDESGTDTHHGSPSPSEALRDCQLHDPRIGSFASGVEALLDTQSHGRAGRVQAVAAEMASRDAAMEAFERVRSFISTRLLQSRLEVLATRFPNSGLETIHTPGGTRMHFAFARTDRIPAKVSLVTGALLDVERAAASLFTRMEVIPVLVALPDQAHHAVALGVLDDIVARGDDASPEARARWDAAVAWLDQQLLAIVQLYLSFETDAGYQKLASHVDPVCGMRVSGGSAAAIRDFLGRRYYLCSTTCASRFASNPGFYVDQRREPMGA